MYNMTHLKRTLASTSIIFLVAIVVNGQDGDHRRLYNTWLTTMDTSLAQRVHFITAADSGIWIQPKRATHRPTSDPGQPEFIPVACISLLQFQKHGRMGRTMAIVAPIALMIGLSAGFKNRATGQYASIFPDTEFRPERFVIGAGICLGLGAIIGSLRTKVHVDGRKARYDHVRPMIQNSYGAKPLL